MKKLAFALSLLLPVAVWSHGGAKDSSGCHKSGKSGYHCHAAKAAKVDSMNGLSANEKRLKRECKGAVNAGACAGFAR